MHYADLHALGMEQTGDYFVLSGVKTGQRWSNIGEDLSHDSCSIGLYVSNLMRKVVPEEHFQIPDENHGTRRLTPDRMAFDAFGYCTNTWPNQAVLSLQAEPVRISDLCHIHPIGVMY